MNSKKKIREFVLLEKSTPRKKTMNKQNLDSREKLSPGEYIVLYPGKKKRLKQRLFLPAILAGN